jgi:PTH2 family peptidyl-tRNA hydrolase
MTKELDEILAANLAAAFLGDVRDDRDQEGEGDFANDPKMWLFVRKDLVIPLEKLIAQGAHVAVTCALNEFRQGDAALVDNWQSRGQAKITKRAKNEAELWKVYRLCREAGLSASIVTDAARTYFDEKTVTMAAVGPCMRSSLPKAVDGLQLLTAKDILALQPNNQPQEPPSANC